LYLDRKVHSFISFIDPTVHHDCFDLT